jgi:hypothetical protein
MEMNNYEMKAEIVIAGGGTGGCAAALACAKMGKKVVMIEETDWIGGQLTSQAVPPDEHPWIEQFGCTRSYGQFRNQVRRYYQRNFPLSPKGASSLYFNPGNAFVSRISCEPRAALAVLNEMLAPYIHSGILIVLTKHKLLAANSLSDHLKEVNIVDLQSGRETVISAEYFLDATECGDLLPLANIEYVTGSESTSETGEPHALRGPANPTDMQSFTCCFAVDYIEGGNFTIDRPKDYGFWKQYKADFWPDSLLSWKGSRPTDLEPIEYTLFPRDGLFSLWNYRRIIDRTNFSEGAYLGDISLVNWPQNDYWLGPIIDVDEEERNRHIEQAKQLSLSLLYWMQTEAPRPDGKAGYPGLRLRPDVVGTQDGLAKYPYIRESRRIKAEFTIYEQHVSPDIRGEQGAEAFGDSVGIGCYRMDLHPSTGNRNYIYMSSLPFQIPLGALIPIRMENVLAACKNIGTTHITNGCYRLHPVEWNIGEAAGYLAAFCLQKQETPRQVRSTPELLEDFQQLLRREGIELEWPYIHSV